MIRLQNVSKKYRTGGMDVSALDGVSLCFEPGEYAALLGPSGSGKSTLLHILGCLDRPTSGSYILDGKEVSKLNSGELSAVRAQKIGFIFQSFNLLPYLSAISNVELGQKYASKIDSKLAREALATVGLADRMNHKPTELSGGEQQRVAVARALAKNPPIILADEPTGNLDSHASKEIMSILVNLHKEQNITLVMITHDPNIAHYCQRIVYLEDGLVIKEEKL